MKQKILAAILISAFAMSSVLGVMAANSSQGTPSVSENNKGYYIIRTGAEQFVDDNGTVDTSDDVVLENKDEILAYNAGTKTLKSLLTGYEDVYKEVEKKTALTPVFDLHDVNNGQMVGGKHVVTINVPSMTANCSDVKVLHYSMQDDKWEILTESTADTAKKTVTIVSDDLSPIAIFATVNSGSGTGTSPSTGVESSYTWMIAAAVILVATGVVVIRKRRLDCN